MSPDKPLKIGDLVRVGTTTEAMRLIAIDGEEAWCRYDEGTHKAVRLEDLEIVRSKAWYQFEAERVSEREHA